MAQTHFKKLDRESRALHDSWDQIGRVSLIVTLMGVVVWAATSGLRWAVHHASESLLHHSEEGLTGAAVLIGVLATAGIIRGFLYNRPGWDDAAGDGMEMTLANYHITYEHAGDDPQPRYDRPTFSIAARKSAATFLTLGSGGSGGLEAPVVMISEALASGISRLLRIQSEYELRTYQIAAISAAVSTLLGAPFTAALFATEIAYGDRIIYRKMAYAMWAGVIATILNNRIHGYHPLFTGPAHAPTYTMTEYGAAALVAIAVSVPLALGFARAMVHTRALFDRLHPRLHALITSLGVGAVGLGLWWGLGIAPRHVLGMGEATISALLQGTSELNVWWMLLAVLVGKLITTGLTIHGGGSAGMLIPSMYLGGVSGALMAQVLNLTGWVSLDPALFAVVGIGSSLVAVIGVPLAAIALVLEVFGKSFGPPAILACGVTYLVTLKFKIYNNQRLSPAPAQDEVG